MPRCSWHVITGEYPPQHGGVSDYCWQLVHALEREGDEVQVWAPPADGPSVGTVKVHRLRGRFGVFSLRELGARIDRCPPPRRLVVQYVAGAFGFRALNLLFCLWLYTRRADTVWITFHEYAYPVGWKLKLRHNLRGAVTQIMGAIVAARADRVFVSTPAWIRRLPSSVRRSISITWLPIPSNIPVSVDDEAATAVRERIAGGRTGAIIGHFGTYGPATATQISEILPELLRRDPSRTGLLVGRGSRRFAEVLACQHPEIGRQLVATGGSTPDQTAANLRACCVLVQPYSDGATTRRGTLMAGLALGLPIVTNTGELTEPVWGDSGAVVLAADHTSSAIVSAAEELLCSPSRWEELGRRAAALYTREFSLARTVQMIRSMAALDESSENVPARKIHKS